MRSQVYRQFAIALGFRGQGVQAKWKKPVLEFARGAWKYDEDVRGEDCPPLSDSHLIAYEQEGIPSEEMVTNFMKLLKRIPDL